MTLLLALLLLSFSSRADEPASPAWEVNGIRLEAHQVERLSEDVARQTVAAVQRLEGLALTPEQAERLEAIYRETARQVYGAALDIVAEDELDDHEKERRIMDRVLAGQQASTKRVAEVLDPAQYALYRRWEEQQVERFRARGLGWKRERRRGRRR